MTSSFHQHQTTRRCLIRTLVKQAKNSLFLQRQLTLMFRLFSIKWTIAV